MGGTVQQWRQVTVPALSGGYPVKIIYGNDRWLMIAYIGGYYQPLVSTDNGETWAAGSFSPLSGFGSPAVEYFPGSGLFVCTNTSAFFTSSTGLGWNWYTPPTVDGKYVGGYHFQGIFKDRLLGFFSSNQTTSTSDGFSWAAPVTLPPNTKGGSYDYTKPIACGPDRALITPYSAGYWATDDGISFTIQSAPDGIVFGNAAHGFGSFFATDSTGTVPTNKIHKSTTGLTGSWQTTTLPGVLERGAGISATEAAVVALSQYPVAGSAPRAAISLEGHIWSMTGPCGNAQYQPRTLKGVGKRFIAGGPTITPPYTTDKIYILDVL